MMFNLKLVAQKLKIYYLIYTLRNYMFAQMKVLKLWQLRFHNNNNKVLSTSLTEKVIKS